MHPLTLHCMRTLTMHWQSKVPNNMQRFRHYTQLVLSDLLVIALRLQRCNKMAHINLPQRGDGGGLASLLGEA